jgi:hypothetical protein
MDQLQEFPNPNTEYLLFPKISGGKEFIFQKFPNPLLSLQTFIILLLNQYFMLSKIAKN